MYKFFAGKVCPKCRAVNRFDTNQNWLGKCLNCRTILANVPVTCNENQGTIFDDPIEYPSIATDLQFTDAVSWSKAYNHVVIFIEAARTLQNRGDYQGAINKATEGFAILNQMTESSPNSEVNRVSLWVVLSGIRATCYYATGISQNWDLALKDVRNAEDLLKIYQNFPLEASKSFQILRNIKQVIEQRRHY